MSSVKRRGVIQLCHWSVLNDGLAITESLTIPPESSEAVLYRICP